MLSMLFLLSTSVHWCDYTYRAESYAFGFASDIYNDSTLKPTLMDQGCYDMGKDRAKIVKFNPNCIEYFESAKSDGLINSPFTTHNPDECTSQGYRYGQALLSTSARLGKEDVVGSECVSYYQKGRNAGCTQQVKDRPFDNKLAYCYLTGYADGIDLRTCGN